MPRRLSHIQSTLEELRRLKREHANERDRLEATRREARKLIDLARKTSRIS
jgi:hypothetical protein